MCLKNFTKPISKNGVFHNKNIIAKEFKSSLFCLCISSMKCEASSHEVSK